MKEPRLRMRTILLSCMFVCLTAQGAWTQAPGQVVKAKVTMASQVARPNSAVRAAVVAEVASGYHINDHHPSLNYLIPTEIKLEPSKQVAVQEVTYPKGVPRMFTFSDSPLSVYEGMIRIDLAFQVARRAPLGNYKLKGQLAYQACNDHACLPPASAPLTFAFQVTRRGSSAKKSSHHAAR